MIAGDGYAYVPYLYYTAVGASGGGTWEPPDPPADEYCSLVGYVSYNTTTWHLRLLRVGTTGDSYEIPLGDWQSYEANNNFQSVYVSNVSLITNADQGVLASYEVDTYPNTGSMTSAFYLATTSGPSIASNTQVAMVPEQASPVQPVLQRADGSYVGTVSSSVGNFMVAFTASGNTVFTVPNDTPQIATQGGGVIGASGTTYDQNGNITGQLSPLPTYSWTGSAYKLGSVESFNALLLNLENSYSAFVGGNASGSGTANLPASANVQGLIAQIASSYVGSENWLDTPHNNKCNKFVQFVLEQAGLDAPLSPNPGLGYRMKYYLGLASTPSYPALAADWANPSTNLKCWRPVTVNPGNPPLPPGTLPPDISIPGDIIAETINYSDASGHVGIIVGSQETVSADSAAVCFPPYSPAGIIDISNWGFRADNWVDPYKNSLGQPCRSTGQESKVVVKRFVCQ